MGSGSVTAIVCLSSTSAAARSPALRGGPRRLAGGAVLASVGLPVWPRVGLGLAGAVIPLLPPGQRVADGDGRRDRPLQYAYRSGDAEAGHEAYAFVLDVADYGQVNAGLDHLVPALQPLLLTVVALPIGC